MKENWEHKRRRITEMPHQSNMSCLSTSIISYRIVSDLTNKHLRCRMDPGLAEVRLGLRLLLLVAAIHIQLVPPNRDIC
jgi:hypothetical protein